MKSYFLLGLIIPLLDLRINRFDPSLEAFISRNSYRNWVSAIFGLKESKKMVSENKRSKVTTDPKKLLRLLRQLSPSAGQPITKESKKDNPVVGGYK